MTATAAATSGSYDLPEMPGAGLDSSWMRDAACNGEPPELWNPDRPDHWKKGDARLPLDAIAWLVLEGTARKNEAIAKRVCATCPVKAACQDYAIRARIVDGVWGGQDGRERANVKHRAKKQKWREARAAQGLPTK